MESLHIYFISTAAFMALQAAPLLLGPRMTINLTESHVRDATDLETDLTRLMSLALFTLAALVLVPVMSIIPISTSPNAEEGDDLEDIKSVSSAGPTVLITIVYHTLRSIHGYSRYLSTGKGGTFLPGTIVSVVLAVMGIGCALFAGDKERGSSWLFTPVEKRAKHVEKRDAKLDKLKKKR